jgi:hypothetical protein
MDEGGDMESPCPLLPWYIITRSCPDLDAAFQSSNREVQDGGESASGQRKFYDVVAGENEKRWRKSGLLTTHNTHYYA